MKNGVVQLLLAGAALVTACGVLWRKLFLPAIRAGNKAESMWKQAEQLMPLLVEIRPMLVELNQAFRGKDGAIAVLAEIVSQVRTDSGSSLLDQVNKVATAAEVARSAVDDLTVGAETDRRLDERDREQLTRLLLEQDRITNKLDTAIRTLLAVQSAAGLDRTVVAEVAADLAASHERADAVDGPHGAAADAASQTATERTE